MKSSNFLRPPVRKNQTITTGRSVTKCYEVFSCSPVHISHGERQGFQLSILFSFVAVPCPFNCHRKSVFLKTNKWRFNQLMSTLICACRSNMCYAWAKNHTDSVIFFFHQPLHGNWYTHDPLPTRGSGVKTLFVSLLSSWSMELQMEAQNTWDFTEYIPQNPVTKCV